MKNLILLSTCILFLLPFPSPCQVVFGDQQILSTAGGGAKTVHIADLNEDGDLDILVGSQTNDIVFWFENLDGLGTFSSMKIISNQVEVVESVYAEDLDGDGDLDVLSASRSDDKIAWYENNGSGGFGSQQVITLLADGAWAVYAHDLDGDGDKDVLSVSGYDHKIAWYENLDGLGSFGVQHIINTQSLFPRFVRAADIDNDGDEDVLSVSSEDEKVAWYENLDGLGNFSGEKVIASYPNDPFSIYPADMDGDGDWDVLVSLRSGKIYWYENEDGFGTFGTYKVVAPSICDPWQAFPTDIDNDGDLDVISSAQCADEILWYENLNGLGVFGPKRVISTAVDVPDFTHSGDLDNDGDQDVVSVSWLDHKVAWYENLLGEPILSGVCFYDLNENAIKDPGEIVLFNQSVSIEPEAIISFTDESGIFRFIVYNGEHWLSAIAGEYWQLTNAPSDYQVTVENDPIEDLNYGFIPDTLVHSSDIYQTLSSTRCEFVVPFWINFENTGTTYLSGYLSFKPDTLAFIVSTSPQPDSIENGIYYWAYDNLPPTYSDRIDVELQMPSEDFIGDTLSLTSSIFILDSLGNWIPSQTDTLYEEVNCAFDPNDKLVLPQGIEEAQYTLFGNVFEYTIRFQNTGTDTAFTVRIEDQLDTDLDWSTFNPLAASHSFETTLDQNLGIVEFLFRDILLPDSSTNEVASHGFVKFLIHHADGLVDSTEVTNTASIFFDNNSPVITNTTLNTLVNAFVGVNEPKRPALPLTAFPNPSSDLVFLKLDSGENDLFEFQILDALGRVLQSGPWQNEVESPLSLRDYPAGVYLIQLRNGERVGMVRVVKGG